MENNPCEMLAVVYTNMLGHISLEISISMPIWKTPNRNWKSWNQLLVINHASTKWLKCCVSKRDFFFVFLSLWWLFNLDRGFSEKNISFRPAQFRGKDLVSFTMHNWQKQTLNDMKVRDKGLQVTGLNKVTIYWRL